jgi:hypothetical protein
MSGVQSSETPEESVSPRRSGRAAVALVLKGTVLLIAAYLSVFAIFAFVPEVNDFADGSIIKHRRLAETGGRRIVLIGGSNLSFGVDSAILEGATGCSVVNMGMNGYLGVRFMLEEAKPYLRTGDIVVIAFEYDNFHKSVDGTAVDQLIVVKANPEAFSYLTFLQRQAVLRAVPYVAQQKVLRLIREAKDSALTFLLDRDSAPTQPSVVDINVIESASGYTDRGDLISHLGISWPYDREDGIDMTHTPRDTEVVPLMADFAQEMTKEGIDVLVSYTPVIRDYYDRHRGAIDRLHTLMANSPPLTVPSPPSVFVYNEPFFFDTVYHLNADGRTLRSQRLSDDIRGHFNGVAPCIYNSFTPP